jgi:hypothetical protein
MHPVDTTTESSSLSKGVLSSISLEFFEQFIDGALAYARETRGLGDIRAAWDLFRVWLEPSLNFASEDWRLFVSWYVFHWHPPGNEQKAPEPGASIAERYYRERMAERYPELSSLVASGVKNPLDFYEVHFLPEMSCYYVKSLFLGYQYSFAFETLPEELKIGGVFFGKILHLGQDRGIILGHSRSFSVRAKVGIGRLRRDLVVRRRSDYLEEFWLFDSDVFNLYHDLRQTMH